MEERYAIILGARVRPDGSATPALQRRAERGAELLQAGLVDGIVTTGGAGRGADISRVSEAQAAARVLTGLGILPTAIVQEDRSRNTRENIAFAIACLPPGAKLVLVSDAWHLPRARLIARRLGHPAQAVAASTKGTSLRGTLKQVLREAGALLWEIPRPLRRADKDRRL